MPGISLHPVQPYSLTASAWGSNPSRRTQGGVVELVFRTGDAPAHARVWQRPDGSLRADIESSDIEAAVAHLRFVFAVDVDHTPFLELAANDELLRGVVLRNRGRRSMRTSTVAHAALQAIAGQLITTAEARRIEFRVMAAAGTPHRGLVLPPTTDELARLSAAELTLAGLAQRRAAALARLVRQIDLEGLHNVPTKTAVARICRERTLGPWSAGVIVLDGLGRYEHGRVGDLGLMRLCTALLGRAATAEDTSALLAPYGAWAGLAGDYLLHHPLARQRYATAA